MKKFSIVFSIALIALYGVHLYGQDAEVLQKPTLIGVSETVIEVPSIASQIANGTFIPAENIVKEFNPKKWGANTSVPGKGLPVGAGAQKPGKNTHTYF
jgi:hypothetical protein